MSASKVSSPAFCDHYASNINYWRCSYQWTVQNFLSEDISEATILSPTFYLHAPGIFIKDYPGINMKMIYNAREKHLVFSYKPNCEKICCISYISDIKGVLKFSLRISDRVIYRGETKFICDVHNTSSFVDMFVSSYMIIPNTELKSFVGNYLDEIVAKIKNNKNEFTAELEFVLPFMSLYSKPIDPPKPKNKKLIKKPTGLIDLYQNSELTDVTITVQETPFKSHRLILSAYSPVFKALFNHDMKENITSKVEITDFEPETFKIMIDSMYKQGELNIESLHLAMELYVAADKYDIDYVKEASSDYMLENVNIENALNILNLVEKHNDSDLKNAIESFIVSNLSRLSNELKSEIVRDRPHLLENILEFKYTE